MRSSAVLAGFLGGVALGAVAGILFAPDKGSETRAKIIEALKEKGLYVSREQLDALVLKIKNRLNFGCQDEDQCIKEVIDELV